VSAVAERRTDGSIDGARSRTRPPRASGPRLETRSPRHEIVAVATRLFAERGFAQTTMSEIARAAGLQQSSLWYWFEHKELILQAAFAVNRVPLEFIERMVGVTRPQALPAGQRRARPQGRRGGRRCQPR
jgi:AcrR family transcriptional regulator